MAHVLVRHCEAAAAFASEYSEFTTVRSCEKEGSMEVWG